MTIKILILPGDGIGPEVMLEVDKVIDWFNKNKDLNAETEYDLVGGASYDANKTSISDSTMTLAKESDAILLGAVGGPKWDKVEYENRPEAGLLRLRKDLDLFANLRPAICFSALSGSSTLKKEVIEDLKNLFPNTSYRDEKRRPHDDDPSGKSLVEEFYFNFNNGELATVSCFDWSEEREAPDQLRIGLFNKEIYDWLADEAY